MSVYLLAIAIFLHCLFSTYASYHWIVTESDSIQAQIENSAFPIRRPYDLMSLLEQENRITAVRDLYQTLLKYKQSIDHQWGRIEGEGDLEKRLYSSDVDCLKGVKPLSQHDLNMDFVDYDDGKRIRIKAEDWNSGRVDEPDCTKFYALDFSMMTFPHLQTLNRRENISIPLDSLLTSSSQFLYDVSAMLKRNNTDWSAFNLAAYYWRILGNGTNALECARRAIYFAPRHERHIPLFNLGTLLQRLRTLAESAIVLHAAVDHDPTQHSAHLALGNVYAALGDHTRAKACYDNVLSLWPGFQRAVDLRHALLCHRKLEMGLLEIHTSLQNILQDLQEHHELQDKWLTLQNQLTFERHAGFSPHFTLHHPANMDMHLLLKNVEDQAKMLKAEMASRVSKRNGILEIQPKVERNHFKSEVVFDCTAEKCPVYLKNQDAKAEEKPETPEKATEDDEDGDLEIFEESPETVLKNKMESLIAFIKSLKYDSDFDITEFRSKIGRQIDVLRRLNDDVNLSIDQSLFLNNFERCVNRNIGDGVKDMGQCFIQVFDRYSIDVSTRIEKLKEKIKYINEASVNNLVSDEAKRKNVFFDEGSLENYVEKEVIDGMAQESCQKVRDSTEL